MRSKNYNLFICEGYHGSCSYCSAGFAIGICKSKRIDTVFDEFIKAVNSGFITFSIAGDDIGAYGLDIHTTFGELMQQLIARSRALQNGKRFSFLINGLQPRWTIEYDSEIEEIISSGMVEELMCPVQSGNDKILGLMRRYHTSAEIRKVLNIFKQIAPKMKLTTEIIIGFPFETREEFQDTLVFLENTTFDKVTLLPYDDRRDKKAQRMAEQVSRDEIDYRIRMAIKYLRQRDINFHIGSTTEQ